MGTESLVSLKNVELAFPAKGGGMVRVLNRLSMEVPQGEIVAILGPSGCGKSSLLRIVAGLIPFGSGRRETPQLDSLNNPLAVSMNFQRPVLLPWLSVVQNALLPFELSRQTITDETKTWLEELLEIVGLSGFRDSLPSELSGGMQMRAALVRAFVTGPRLLLMDEPFSSLDELTRHRLGVELKKITKSRNVTVMFVTHSIQEAVFIADRVFLLSPRPAHVVAEIKGIQPEDIIERPENIPNYLTTCERIRELSSYD